MKIIDTAIDGIFHGPQRCCRCGELLEGHPWGSVRPSLDGWMHYRPACRVQVSIEDSRQMTARLI